MKSDNIQPVETMCPSHGDAVLRASFIGNLLQALLCLIIINAGVSMIDSSFGNMRIIWYHELLFICAYLCTHGMEKIREVARNNPHFFTLFLLWFGWIAWVTFNSSYRLWEATLTRNTTLEIPTHILFAVTLYQFCIAYRTQNWIFLISICCSTVLMAFYFIYKCSMIEWTAGDLYEHPPMHAHLRHAGFQVSAALSIFLPLLPWKGGSRVSRVLITVGFLICFTFLIWMSSRAQFLAIIITFLFLRIYIKHLRGNSTSLTIQFTILACISIGLSALFPDYGYLGFRGMFGRLLGLQLDDSRSLMNIYSSGRMEMWAFACDKIAQRPFTGYGTLSYMCMDERPNHSLHLHNLLFQRLIEWGVIGTSLFFSMLYIPLKVIVAHVQNSWGQKTPLSTPLLASIAVLFTLSVIGLSDGTWFHGQSRFYLAIAWAIALAEIRKTA